MGTKKIRTFVLSFVILLVVVFCALRWGSTGDLSWDLILKLRLPRVLLGLAVGAGLAVSGATLQSIFSNPLCEPYTLGISSGSTLGAVVGASLGVELNFGGLTGPAFIGALVFALLLQGASRRASRQSQTVLLTGVMLGFLGSSLVALWMALADSQGLQGALIWLLGSLSRARAQGAVVSVGAAAMFILLIWRHHSDLDAMLMGEEDARSLGIDVPRVRRRLILITSLLIGLCVTGGGMIGFVGLVVPHFARRAVGALHRGLIPLCALWGGTVLIGSDLMARTVASPNELPVGVLTALMGAPLFLWMMLSDRRRT